MYYKSLSVKSVCIRIFYGLYFPAFGLNTETYRVSIRIQSECGKTRLEKTEYGLLLHSVS